MRFDLEKASGSVAYRLLIGLVAPRPIALITTMDEEGRLNAAPFSAFNYFGTEPPIVGVGVQNRPDSDYVPKDTARNIRRTGEFVVNVVTEDIAQQMNICATDFPAEMNEVELAGLTTAPSEAVQVPRIAEAHAALECREYATVEIGRSRIVLGRVVNVYVDDRFVDPAGPYIKSEELHADERAGQLRAHTRRVPPDSADFVWGVEEKAVSRLAS
jgi:flavin reductase (DIM6/NTAB) family NADH-FMN oxidoreductase RutF